jgi:hypothetical protein
MTPKHQWVPAPPDGSSAVPLSKAPNASRDGCLSGRKSETIEPTDPRIWGISVQNFPGERAICIPTVI